MSVPAACVSSKKFGVRPNISFGRRRRLIARARISELSAALVPTISSSAFVRRLRPRQRCKWGEHRHGRNLSPLLERAKTI